ncbi:hypothetical protein [Sphingobium aquiterrae]|uniref:hypothetical protein n=1 Tax=Sphingobium aquiterrae TaxID=2038656 RepID=UPI00301787C2|tara:strand:+ start:8502 stop:8963 length:462 start_codon:yes stop_codon:yes gene_type:complete
MDIIVTRSRIAETLPHHEYRSLVCADAVDEERRRRTCVIKAPRIAGCVPCLRIAPVIAPYRYFALKPASREILGSRIGALARRIETLMVRAVFPEMAAERRRLVITLDHDPGDACVRTDIDDLTGAFDRLEPHRNSLTACDLGLRQDCARHAA